MAASENSQHRRGQLREKTLRHLVVCFLCTGECVYEWVSVQVRALLFGWLRSYILTTLQLDDDTGDCMTRVFVNDWICGNSGWSYLPLCWPLPLPGCRGIIRRRFVKWTARLARCPRGAGGTCGRNIIGQAVAPSLETSINLQLSDLYPPPPTVSSSVLIGTWSKSYFPKHNKPPKPITPFLLHPLPWPSVC